MVGVFHVLIVDRHVPHLLTSSWDYNYTVGEIAGRRLDCNCGSSECRRRVL
jgi:hypothetical protein